MGMRYEPAIGGHRSVAHKVHARWASARLVAPFWQCHVPTSQGGRSRSVVPTRRLAPCGATRAPQIPARPSGRHHCCSRNGRWCARVSFWVDRIGERWRLAHNRHHRQSWGTPDRECSSFNNPSRSWCAPHAPSVFQQHPCSLVGRDYLLDRQRTPLPFPAPSDTHADAHGCSCSQSSLS